jgi:hypothetical protein
MGTKITKLSTGGSGGAVEVYDEGVLVTSVASKLNFVGADIEARQTGEFTNIYSPVPTFSSHFNTYDGLTNGNVPDISTTLRYISAPTSEGTPFKIGDWVAGTSKSCTTSTVLSYTTLQKISILNNTATTLEAILYDADGTTPLATHQITLTGNTDVTSDNIQIVVTSFIVEGIKYSAILQVKFNISTILPDGGRFSIKITHNNGADGIFTKTQNNLFFDSNNNNATVTVPTITEVTPFTTACSGVYYYRDGSVFNVSISDIDYVNDKSYPLNQVEILGTEYGLPQLLIPGASLTSWSNIWNNINASYTKADWTLNVANYYNVSTTAKIQARAKDWVDQVLQDSSVASICVMNYTDNRTGIFEDFRNEGFRVTSALASWDSFQNLSAYDGNDGLMIQGSRLIYPSGDYTTYSPNTVSQPDYSTETGDRTLYTKFYHLSTSHSNGIIAFGDHNILEANILSQDIKIELSLDGIDWYNVCSDYIGGALANGSGCRVESDAYSITINNSLKFTLGTGKSTTVSTGSGWGVWVRLTYTSTMTTKYIGSINFSDWV